MNQPSICVALWIVYKGAIVCMCNYEHRMCMPLPQWLDVWRGRQYNAPKTHLQSRQPQRVQDPCTRLPHSLKRPRSRVSTASVCIPPLTSHHGPPSRSSLHSPVPQVVLAVTAGEMDGAHAEAAQHTGATVHTATLGRECTYEGRQGVS